jgi:hypothetical protein
VAAAALGIWGVGVGVGRLAQNMKGGGEAVAPVAAATVHKSKK